MEQSATVVADPEGQPTDDQVYVVTYFNGTTEEVHGLAEVRRRIMDPASRGEDTDRDGFVGATYSRKR